MNFGRSPILLIVAVFFLLFIVLSFLNRKSSTSLNDNDRALRTDQALNRVMGAEATYLKQHKVYSGHIADLTAISPPIATDLIDGVVSIQVDSTGNRTYFVQVASTVVAFNRTVESGKVTVKNCLQLKSAGKQYCTRTTSDVKKTLPNGPSGATGATGPTGPTGK